MYLRWLQAFHAAAELGSFTAAARKLRVGQPTISTHIKTLEDRFRVELFYRNGRNVVLTPIGQALLAITHGIFGHEDEAVALLSKARDQDVGELRIATIRPSDAIEILSDYSSRHPHVMLRLTVGSSPSILQDLLNFKCDVGVVGYEPDDQRFSSTFYNRHAILAVVGVRHPFARRRALRLDHLKGERMILRAHGSTTRATLDAALAAADITVRPVMETDSREALLRAVAHGIGIGVITESEFVAMSGIRAVPIAASKLQTHAYVVCLAERRSRPLIGAFLDVVRKKSHRI